MKLYFKPILLAEGDVGGQGSGDEGGGEEFRSIVNRKTEAGSVFSVMSSADSLELDQSVEVIAVEDPLEMPSVEPDIIQEVETVIDFIDPAASAEN